MIYAVLFGLTLVGFLLAGYGMVANQTPSWTNMVGFALS
jgi:hypothetical protein